MIIFDADDPLVLNGTYDREGYKPGERGRIAKARARQLAEEKKQMTPDAAQETIDATVQADTVEQVAEELHDLTADTDEMFTQSPDDPDAPNDQELAELNAEPLAGELAKTATQYDAATLAEKRHETPDSGVFDGPYDATKALEQIFDLVADVERANADFKTKNEKAKEAKKELDDRREALETVIYSYRDRTRNISTEQPRLKTLDETKDELVWPRCQRMAKELETRNLFVDASELSLLTREELDTLDLWVRQAGPVPPALIERACICGPYNKGTKDQRCTKCLNVVAVAPPQPEGTFVGLSCKQTPQSETVKTPKKRTRRVPPEVEQVAQREEGKKRARKKR